MASSHFSSVLVFAATNFPASLMILDRHFCAGVAACATPASITTATSDATAGLTRRDVVCMVSPPSLPGGSTRGPRSVQGDTPGRAASSCSGMRRMSPVSAGGRVRSLTARGARASAAHDDVDRSRKVDAAKGRSALPNESMKKRAQPAKSAVPRHVVGGAARRKRPGIPATSSHFGPAVGGMTRGRTAAPAGPPARHPGVRRRHGAAHAGRPAPGG